MKNLGALILYYFFAYLIVTLIGIFHTIFNIRFLHYRSIKNSSGMGEAYEKTKLINCINCVNLVNLKASTTAKKDQFKFISVIRLPDFVTLADYKWAVKTATEKKQRDFSSVEFLSYDEGICVQCLHIGAYDNEPITLAAMSQYAAEQGYEVDIQNPRYHHEIYLSDPRRCQVDKLKTVIRHPIKLLKV